MLKYKGGKVRSSAKFLGVLTTKAVGRKMERGKMFDPYFSLTVHWQCHLL
jgi:hypothetical protein